jgi:hypothetical protein
MHLWQNQHNKKTATSKNVCPELATRPPDVIFICKYLNFSYLNGIKMTVKKCPIFDPSIKCLIKTELLKKKNLNKNSL